MPPRAWPGRPRRRTTPSPAPLRAACDPSAARRARSYRAHFGARIAALAGPSWARRTPEAVHMPPAAAAHRGVSRRVRANTRRGRLAGARRSLGSERLQPVEQARQVLGHRRMHVHRARDDRVGGAGVHQVEQGVHHLVALDAEQSGAEDLLRARVHQDLHEALGLAALEGAAHVLHEVPADEDLAAGGAGLSLVHPAAPERRIGVERVGRDALAQLAAAAVEEVGLDDLVVVVRGVREAAVAVAVAERPDARDAGAQLLVDADHPLRVGLDAGPLEREIVRVGHAADGEEQVRADHLGSAFRAAHPRHDVAPPRLEGRALGPDAYGDALLLQDAAQGGGDVLVLARDEPRAALQDRDLAAEAPVDLPELEADVAAADDDQVRRQLVERQEARVVEVRDALHPGHLGPGRARPDVDEDPLRAQHLAVDCDRVGPDEAAVPAQEADVLVLLEALRHRLARPARDRAHALLDAPHVHAHRFVQHDAVLGRAPRHGGHLGARDQRLGRDAPRVDAGAARLAALEHGHPPAFARHAPRERGTGLARTDHDGVELPGHRFLPPARPR